MSRSSIAAVAALALVAGIAIGIASSHSAVYARLSPSVSVTQQGSASEAPNIRGLLDSLLRTGTGFILTGIEDSQGCSVQPTAVSFAEDYMDVRSSQGPEFVIPYSAIFRIYRKGPGAYAVPVIYTTAYPRPKFCGD